MRGYENVGHVPAGLYTGDVKSRPLGDTLRLMMRRGRTVVDAQAERWAENRAMFDGNPYVRAFRHGNGKLRVVARDQVDFRGRRRNAVNISRGLVKGRVSLLTRVKPPTEVLPDDLSQDAVEGARVAERFVEAMWGTTEWDVGRWLRDLCRGGEVDGVQFLYVGWDPEAGPPAPVMEEASTGEPVDTPGDASGLRAVAPDGDTREGQPVWRMGKGDEPMGDVCFRVVKPGAVFVDPFMTTDWSRARYAGESRFMSRAEVEARAGMTLKELYELSKRNSRRGRGGDSSPTPPEGDGLASTPGDLDDERAHHGGSSGDEVVVHCIYVLPHGDWPRGAYIEWVEGAAAAPLVAEPFEDRCLPYMPYTPSPGGHVLRSRGTMDELAPIAREFNTMLTLLADWMRLVAKPPVGVPEGGLVSSSVYNEDGFYVYRAGLGEPHHMNVPGEPAAVISGYMGTLKSLAAEAAVQPDAARGFQQDGVTAGVMLNAVAQQVENQLSEAEGELIRVLEWAVTRALDLVAQYYRYPRMVAMPGILDTVQMEAFKGSALKGARRFRVKGSMLPRQRGAVIQTILQLLPLVGPDIKPFIGQLMDGDPEGWLASQEQHKDRQRREIRDLVSLTKVPQLKTLWGNFQEDLAKFSEAVQVAGQDPMRPPGVGAMDWAAQQAGAIRPPRFIDALRDAGVRVPVAQPYDDDPQHVVVLTAWMVTEEFERLPAPVQQATREHHMEHVEKIGGNLAAQQQLMGAEQQGSMAKPVGQPSAPAMRGTQSPSPTPSPVGQ